MTDSFISKFCLELQPGYDEDIRALRITLDPVQAYHRPLVFYICMACITFMIHHVLFEQCWRMQQYQCGHLTYWLRSGGANKSDNKKPIVFIHGIGPGFLPYINFLCNLMRLDDGASDVFCVELPHVSMRCIEHAPSMHQTVRDLRFMLAHHGYRDAVFVAHSLGTGLVSWVLQHSPKTVAAVVMLDPICFMLHYKDVCYNFVYRIPKTASEYIVKFFASTELYISYYISRQFHWFQLALYVTPSYLTNSPYASTTTITMPRNTKVFLSEHDNIVHSDRVHDYLVTNAIDSTVMEGLDHGWFLLKSSWQSEIMAAIKEFASDV
ncbi:alpha/beta-hydrolase [Lichtheimia hyalospora FSU 10163]|nr:alpha/beta-hydrolase [Lichtheimia hyalospora FSU 10163]